MDSIFDLDHLYRTYFKMALPSVFGLMVSVVCLLYTSDAADE